MGCKIKDNINKLTHFNYLEQNYYYSNTNYRALYKTII